MAYSYFSTDFISIPHKCETDHHEKRFAHTNSGWLLLFFDITSQPVLVSFRCFTFHAPFFSHGHHVHSTSTNHRLLITSSVACDINTTSQTAPTSYFTLFSFPFWCFAEKNIPSCSFFNRFHFNNTLVWNRLPRDKKSMSHLVTGWRFFRK